MAVSIHAPAWGATQAGNNGIVGIVCFNPRSRVGSDQCPSLRLEGLAGFNPRSRVGSDLHPISPSLIKPVSIHAPAWGATFFLLLIFSLGRFQSTLPRGERRKKQGKHSIKKTGFNPRSRVGSDLLSLTTRLKTPLFQSTLPRGERRLAESKSIIARSFNPRSRVGSDQLMMKVKPAYRKFQSTLPRGERRGFGCSALCSGTFQSTLPRGERLNFDAMVKLEVKFQSTLPRGERQTASIRNEKNVCFNPRSRVGSDTRLELRIRDLRVSIHAPAWGATKQGVDFGKACACFNPRSRVGSDPTFKRFKCYWEVSIHAPAWGATSKYN